MQDVQCGLGSDTKNSNADKCVDARSIAACVACVAVTFALSCYLYFELQKPPPDWMMNLGP